MSPFIIPALKFGAGLAQSLFSGKGDAERDLENYAKTYKVSGGIMDYYNKALSRYNPNAYNSNYYTQQKKNIDRNLATGISYAQDRRGALSALPALVDQANNASGKAAATAESLQGQQLGQLGQAAAMKNQAEQKGFDIQYNLKSQKAGQKATLFNNGLQNMFGSLGDAAMLLSGDSQDDGSNAYRMPRMPYNPQKLPY